MVMVMVMNDLLPHPLFNVNRPSHSELQLSMVKAMCVVKDQGHIWPWKFKGHGQRQTHWSHLRPGFQSICLLFFRGNQTIFYQDKANSIFAVFPKSRQYVCFVRRRIQMSDVEFVKIVSIWCLSVQCGRRSMKSIPEDWYLTLKIQGQGHGQGQTRWSHLRPWVQSICLLFVLWQSDHFWLRYSKFHIWPWKFKIKVMAMVKPDGHIWGLEVNRYVCFLFCGNGTIFGWDMANSIFDLENSRSRSRRKSTKI